MKTPTKYFSIAIVIAFLTINTEIFAQVGIGIASPNSNAMLDVTAPDKGFLPPRMTTAERNDLGGLLLASSLPEDKGMLVFDTTLTTYYYWDGAEWVAIAAAGGGYVDLTTNQTVAGMKTFSGDLTPAGRLMLPMGELSFVNLATPESVTMPGGSTGIGSPDNMVAIAPAVAFINDNFTFDNGTLVTSVTNGKLKYTSGDPTNKFVDRYFHIALSFSFSPGSTNNGTYVFGVTLNNDVMPSSKLFLRGTTSGDSQSSAMHVLLKLKDGDEIGYSVGKIDTGSTTISVKSFNFVAIGM